MVFKLAAVVHPVDYLNRNPNNKTAITAVNNFAQDLADRFSYTVGCTRSWDTADPTMFEVRIKNFYSLFIS